RPRAAKTSAAIGESSSLISTDGMVEPAGGFSESFYSTSASAAALLSSTPARSIVHVRDGTSAILSRCRTLVRDEVVERRPAGRSLQRSRLRVEASDRCEPVAVAELCIRNGAFQHANRLVVHAEWN